MSMMSVFPFVARAHTGKNQPAAQHHRARARPSKGMNET